jgi:two-component system, chemotaxis family, protein-glutamate methylesterase/glutaminase
VHKATLMPAQRLVVIGTSAGGIETLRVIVEALPPGFAAPIAVVMHTAADSPGLLHEILNRRGTLPAVQARDRERIQGGRVYVAPPDFHLIIEPGRLRITKGPRENRFRPAIDPLFRSAAQVYGPAAIGIVLTGNLDDGTAGLSTIKKLGGTTIAQDPRDALYPSMPASAIAHVAVDHVVPASGIAPLLAGLIATPVESTGGVPVPDQVNIEVNIAKEENALDAGLQRVARPSSFACPECHGVLLELKEEGRIRFRCHTGHAYSIDSLIAAVDEMIEESMWGAIRSLEEGTMLLRQVAVRGQAHHDAAAIKQLTDRAQELHRQSGELRALAAARQPLAVGVREISRSGEK